MTARTPPPPARCPHARQEGCPSWLKSWSSPITTGETVKKVTFELVTLARQFGEPSVVWAGPGADAAKDQLAEYGAAKVYVADSTDFDDYVVAPKAELLASLVESASPRPRCWSPAPPKAARSPAGWRSRPAPA